MRILVTGSSGFVGGVLAGRLADGGHDVTGTYLTGSVRHTGVRAVKADVADPGLDLPEGRFDAVVHLAALTPLERNQKNLERVNYGGALNLFEKVGERTGLFIYVSGLGVFGDTGGELITESTPVRPHTGFARIRVRAERALRDACAGTATEFCTAYLGDVYGSSGWFAREVIGRILSGRFRIPGGGKYVKSFIHVDDAASALAAVVEKGSGGESYIVADSHPCPFRDLVNYCADGLGRKRPGSVPAFLARSVLGKDAVTLLTTGTAASNAKISGIVGMRYPSYREGLDQILADGRMR